jgi:hypothetical protein
MGLGIPEANRREEVVGSGLHSLDTIVGQEQSKAAYEALKSWISKHGVPEKVFKIPIWDTGEREKKLDIVLESAAQRDSVVTQLKTKEDANVEERIQSRMQVLNEEAALAIDNYRFAMVTHNAPLLAFSQALVVEMSSKDVAGKVFAAPIFVAPPLVPEDKPAKHKGDDDDDDA